jgi:hypothetical protein
MVRCNCRFGGAIWTNGRALTANGAWCRACRLWTCKMPVLRRPLVQRVARAAIIATRLTPCWAVIPPVLGCWRSEIAIQWGGAMGRLPVCFESCLIGGLGHQMLVAHHQRIAGRHERRAVDARQMKRAVAQQAEPPQGGDFVPAHGTRLAPDQLRPKL